MKIFKIENGFFSLDGGTLFGNVPKVSWNERVIVDENNFCKLTMRSLLVEDGDRLILIDTGVGIKHLEMMESFGFSGIEPMERVLSRLGYSCAEVTDVVLSHLHFEHCGGCTYIDSNLSLSLTFPNAMHWCSEAQWRNMITPCAMEEYSYFTADMMEVANMQKIKMITSAVNLTPNVSLRLYDGHSLGQIASFVKSPGDTFLFLGDIIPTSVHVHSLWNTAFDVDPNQSILTKRELLTEAAGHGYVVVFPHDVETPAAKILKDDDFSAIPFDWKA